MLFFFKQKTAYEMRISDWSSDVCSSDLQFGGEQYPAATVGPIYRDSWLTWGAHLEIGRASCRESVSVRVDLGGRRIIKKKKIKIVNNIKLDENQRLPNNMSSIKNHQTMKHNRANKKLITEYVSMK